MLVMDDNNLKLLKMKEKLLEVSMDNERQSILEDYEKLAIEIDKKTYDSLVYKIRGSEYQSLTLEEQLSFLSEIESEYDELSELQYRFRNVYEKYSDDDLNLVDLDSIFIEVIRRKISNISGYLINVNNISESEKELEKLSEKLVSEEQKRKEDAVRFKSLDDELLNNVLKAEGRVFSSVGESTYMSIIKEYELIGVDLKELLSDRELLSEKLRKYEDKNIEQEKLLRVAEVSYESMSDDSYRDVYESIKKDAVRASYELALLKIASLLYQVADLYDVARDKRKKLSDLIKYRTIYLNSMGIRFSIDPFSRIRLNEQIDIVNSIKDNTKDIIRIRKNIFDLQSDIDRREKENEEFLDSINSEIDLIADSFSTLESSIDSYDEIDEEDLDMDELIDESLDKPIAFNQVVSVSKLPDDFMINRVNEKVSGVIKRVHQMIINPVLEVTKSFEVNPQLVIEGAPVFPDVAFDDLDITDEEDVSVYENDESDKMDDYVLPDISELHESDDLQEVDLFQEIEPFDELPLFQDRYDDGVSDAFEFESSLPSEDFIVIDSKKYDESDELSLQEEDMEDNPKELDSSFPEMFWMTQEDDSVMDDTIDEDNGYSKVRSRAA